MSRKLYPVLIAIMVLLSATLACSLLTGRKAAPSPNNNDGPAAQVETAVAGGDSGSPESDKPSNADEGDASVDNVKQGLDALDSYRMTFTLRSAWTDSDNKARESSFDVLYEIDNRNQAYHTKMSGSGDEMPAGEEGAFEYYTLDGKTYMFSQKAGQDPTCMSFTADDSQNGVETFDPSEILGGLEKAKLVKRGETVNGIKSDHFKVNEKTIRVRAWSKASGDVWIAQDGGYIVKYEGEAEGDIGVFTAGQQGKMTWTYNVTDVNQLPEIVVPDICSQTGAAADIPQPDGCTVDSNFQGMVSLSCSGTPADVAEYYRAQFEQQGWAKASDENLGEMAMLKFTKDARTVDIIINADPAGCKVFVTESQ